MLFGLCHLLWPALRAEVHTTPPLPGAPGAAQAPSPFPLPRMCQLRGSLGWGSSWTPFPLCLIYSHTTNLPAWVHTEMQNLKVQTHLEGIQERNVRPAGTSVPRASDPGRCWGGMSPLHGVPSPGFSSSLEADCWGSPSPQRAGTLLWPGLTNVIPPAIPKSTSAGALEPREVAVLGWAGWLCGLRIEDIQRANTATWCLGPGD